MSAPVRSIAGCIQLRADIEMIVNLPVEGDDEAAAIAEHRLRAGTGQIENREPPVTERDTILAVRPDTTCIRATMAKLIRHPAHDAAQHLFVATTRRSRWKGAGSTPLGATTVKPSPDNSCCARGSRNVR